MNPQGLLFVDTEATGSVSRLLNTGFSGELGMRMGRAVTTLARCVDVAILGEGYSRAYCPPAGLRISYGDWIQHAEDEDDVASRFDELAERWITETAAQSSFIRLFSHDAYLEILTLGRDAIPQLLDRLDDEPERWVGALRIITRQSVGANAGSAEEAVAAWRHWGHEHGHRR